MSRVVLVLAGLILSVGAAGQTTVRGFVSDGDGGGPLPGANVAVLPLPSGPLVAEAYFGDDAREMGADPLSPGLFEAAFLVANGTEDWPAGTLDEEDPETSLLLGDSDQIEDGRGFVGGTVTKRVPFEPGLGVCPIPFGAPAERCLSRDR